MPRRLSAPELIILLVFFYYLTGLRARFFNNKNIWRNTCI